MKKTQHIAKPNYFMNYGELIPATPEMFVSIEEFSRSIRVYEGTARIKAQNSILRYKGFAQRKQNAS